MKLDRIIAVRNNKTIYRDGEDCIKLFCEDFSKIDVLNEALNQARVEVTGILIPKIKEVCMINGQWAIVSEYIQGKTLQQLMEENPEKKDEYLNRFVQIQLDILSHTSPNLNKLRDKMSEKIGRASLDATVRYDLLTRLDGMRKHTKICHGDFNPSNIIITKDDDAYIIDWSHATQGNASGDAANTYLLFWLNGDMETAERYLDLFAEKSGIEKKHIQRWMPIVAASRLSLKNEKEREFLLSWANVTDYE